MEHTAIFSVRYDSGVARDEVEFANIDEANCWLFGRKQAVLGGDILESRVISRSGSSNSSDPPLEPDVDVEEIIGPNGIY